MTYYCIQTTSNSVSRVTYLLLSCKSFSSLGLGSFGRLRRCSFRNAVDVEWILRCRSSWRGPRELAAAASPSTGSGQPRVRIRWAIDITPSPFFKILTLNSSTSGKEYVVSPHLKKYHYYIKRKTIMIMHNDDFGIQNHSVLLPQIVLICIRTISSKWGTPNHNYLIFTLICVKN